MPNKRHKLLNGRKKGFLLRSGFSWLLVIRKEDDQKFREIKGFVNILNGLVDSIKTLKYNKLVK